MSKFVTADNLLTTFPATLTEDEMQLALASVTATELVELYEDNDILALYARIDELDEPLLDILAYDFKIDWWDENLSLVEKRETFKNCWNVHRKVGTPEAVGLSLSAIYNNATVKEWFEFEGKPFYFKIDIDSGDKLTDFDKLKKALVGIQHYKNKRSVLESVEINSEKDIDVCVGCAMQGGTTTQMNVAGIEQEQYTLITDDAGTIFTDDKGRILIL